MKSVKNLLAVAIVLGVATLAMAQDKDAPKEKPKGLYGKVVKVDGKNLVVKVRAAKPGDEPKEVTIATDDKTEVTIEGKPAKLEDLKADMRVLVTPETGTAARIAVLAPHKHGDAAPNAPKDGDKK